MLSNMLSNECTTCHKHRVLCGHCDKPKPQFQIVIDGYNDDDDPINYEGKWNDEKEDAATRYVEENYSDLDHPDTVEVTVYENGDGRKFEVHAEPSIEFTSNEIT